MIKQKLKKCRDILNKQPSGMGLLQHMLLVVDVLPGLKYKAMSRNVDILSEEIKDEQRSNALEILSEQSK